MKKVNRIVAVLLLCCIIWGNSVQAVALEIEAAPLFQYGWEDWGITSL